ncbi:allophanate hydrolase [Labrys monachus]|uniref:Allophanate hydrolase n=1 Tax=Labrys monachus TaxID=217067 RepID=A0ABU0FDG1_9HYPH|nr:allophanate hydrolase [Labrys monachus]MDQ0392372.1 allophanate hydrolase [Labrys monachus]
MVPVSFDIASLHDSYRAGLSPVAVVAEVHARHRAAADPGIFICLVEEEEAMRAAAALGPFDPVARPLWGIPFAVKDNIDVAGLPTTAACPAFAYQPQETAAAVERLLRAGAILVGKTNLDQFATGLVGVRTPYPVPRNSFDPDLVPGGSSSGSAVAVARGIVSFALGTDTAGSGRVPAGLNNIVGIKPSLGAIPVHGVVPACKSLDCVSVFALTVEDGWAAYKAMAGPDERDPWSRRIALGEPAVLPPRMAVAVPDARGRIFFGDAAAQKAFDASLDLLASMGLHLVETDLGPFFDVARLLYEGAWVAERYAAIRPFIEASPEALLPVTRQIIGGATRHSAADAFAGLYRLAELRQVTEKLWTRVQALAVPTLPRPYSRADLDADPIGPNSKSGLYTNFVNLLNLCAVASPGPFRFDGLPAGVTFIAPAGRDALAAALAARFHRAADVPLGATDVPQPLVIDRPVQTSPGEVELVVVGAHLSGMALNHELVAAGGRFLREARTACDYRLFALPGPAPKRPGLLRVGEGEGAAIAVEVWALPVEGFGRFVSAVPSPLCIGTVRLADGTGAKGFLCESRAVEGALDISPLGGWRAFMQNGLEPAGT